MKSVLFDLDGTIANTEVLKAKALSQSISSLGGYASADIYKSVMGQSWSSVTDIFFKTAGLKPNLDLLNAYFKEHYQNLIESNLVEENGISNFLRFLKERNISLGIVSSASPWMIEKVLQRLNLNDKFDLVVSNADTSNHKPHPDAYLIALTKLNASKNSTIVFEDTESGFLAATSAGLPVYGVKHSFNQNHNFASCTKTITSFEECLHWEIF